MSWEEKAVKLTLLGFAGTLLYVGCTAPAVQREMRQYPILSEVAGFMHMVDEVAHDVADVFSGRTNLDLVGIMTDLHEPTAPIGEFGRDIGTRYLGLDYNIDLVEGLQQLETFTQPIIDLVNND